jgi:CheY-like chemotaxis protein
MDEESQVGVYSIDVVSRLTGVSAATLRYWERTYGLIKPKRTSGGHRLYSEDDIQLICWVKRKIDQGLKPSAVHELLRREVGLVGRVHVEAASREAILILVAEKDPITAELEEYFLNKQGYDVHIVLDGSKAVQAAEKFEPDLIILDVILPGVSGLRVCTLLKANDKTRSIPVLVFSVLDVRDRALDAGADAFLLKPIDQPKLVEAVKELLTAGRPEEVHQ